jgi:glycyl-tRNA synthetase (class II)
VRLDSSPTDVGGAIRASSTPSTLPATTDTGATDSALLSEVFYEKSAGTPAQEESSEEVTNVENMFDTKLSPNSTNTSPTELYVRSEYAPAYGLDVKKSYRDLSAGFLE